MSDSWVADNAAPTGDDTMATQSNAPKNGLNALLTPEESVLVLIDHQPFQFANLHSHEPTPSPAADGKPATDWSISCPVAM
jgi:hypothetical protein